MEWIKTGWGPELSPDFDASKNFYMDFSNMVCPSKDVLKVAKKVINNIVNEYPKPYYLMVSGGVDSQAMLWLWINSGVDFIPVSIKYTGFSSSTIYNDHDLVQLKEFSNKHDIKVKYINFNVFDFLENHLIEYAKKYTCTSPQLCTHMRMSELITDGTKIFSGNFGIHTHYSYTILGIKRYADINKNVIPFFFLHDKELAGTISPELVNQTDTNAERQLYLNKVKSLTEHGIPVIAQPDKTTGFEKIKEVYDYQEYKLKAREKVRYANKPSKRVFDILFRYRLGETVKYEDRIVYLGFNKLII